VTKDKSKTKAKSQAKESVKDRNKIKGGVDPEVGYDHVEGSVHDLAIRDELFRAYESFKVSTVFLMPELSLNSHRLSLFTDLSCLSSQTLAEKL
jgi:hypothetical protein